MTEEQRMLALRIATLLDDLGSLALHERFVRTYPREFLEEKLRIVLAKDGLENKAAYYTTIIKTNGTRHISRY